MDYSWVLLILALGLQVVGYAIWYQVQRSIANVYLYKAGMIIGTVSASLYIVDAHRKSTNLHAKVKS